MRRRRGDFELRRNLNCQLMERNGRNVMIYIPSTRQSSLAFFSSSCAQVCSLHTVVNRRCGETRDKRIEPGMRWRDDRTRKSETHSSRLHLITRESHPQCADRAADRSNRILSCPEKVPISNFEGSYSLSVQSYQRGTLVVDAKYSRLPESVVASSATLPVVEIFVRNCGPTRFIRFR